jgi:hypothetical protein
MHALMLQPLLMNAVATVYRVHFQNVPTFMPTFFFYFLFFFFRRSVHSAFKQSVVEADFSNVGWR